MSWSEHGRRPAKGLRKGLRFKKAKDRREKAEKEHAEARQEAVLRARRAREAAEEVALTLYFQQARAVERTQRGGYWY